MHTPRDPVEEEIDLFGIVRSLSAHWQSILISVFAFVVVGLATAFLLPKEYRATSTVLLTRPDLLLQFDPRVATNYEVPSLSTLATLSLTDAALEELLESEAANALSPDEQTTDALRKRLSPTPADSTLTLTAKGRDPEDVAALANGWAEIVVRMLNDIYDPRMGSAEAFAADVEKASERWNAAQEALVGYQAGNPERALAIRQESLERQLASLHERDAQLGQVLQDIQALQARVLEVGGASVDRRDSLMSVLLAMRSIRMASSQSQPSPQQEQATLTDEVVQVSVAFPLESVFSQTPTEHVAYLRSLAASIEAQQASFRDELTRLEAEMRADQGQLAEAEEKRSRLEEERNLSLELYRTLIRSAQESAVSAGGDNAPFRVASSAVPPSTPVGPRKTVIVFLAACFGVAVGVTRALALDWWPSKRRLDREADDQAASNAR